MTVTLDNITCVATIASAIFVATQAYLFKKDYKVRNNTSEVEKAINLSRYYKDNILDNTSYLFSIFKAIGIEDILRKVDYTELVEFNKEELKKLLSESERKDISKKLSNIDVDLLINTRILLKSTTKDEFVESTMLSLSNQLIKTLDESAMTEVEKESPKHNKIKSKQTHAKVLYELKSQIYKREFEEVVSNTLNNMEYFAMNFNNNIADEEVVYQSLHQSYLRLVKMLYFYISQQNESGKDKYYTNVIELYVKWNNRYNEKCTQEKMITQKVVHAKKKVKK